MLQSLRLLAGLEAARRFHEAVLRLHEAGGSPVNADSLRYWQRAVEES